MSLGTFVQKFIWNFDLTFQAWDAELFLASGATDSQTLGRESWSEENTGRFRGSAVPCSTVLYCIILYIPLYFLSSEVFFHAPEHLFKLFSFWTVYLSRLFPLSGLMRNELHALLACAQFSGMVLANMMQIWQQDWIERRVWRMLDNTEDLIDLGLCMPRAAERSSQL